MSVRTIVEFNHDLARRIEDNSVVFVAMLAAALSTGDEDYWDDLRRYGIRRVVQAHHSDDRAAVVNGQEHKIW